eukprot:TRINITY_DN13273_c0_g1_i2.p1 TRINITY_DN13273_c0_g1~~TRINITY_DN13273_c0_g1_i2.p1  ORF type:complete len:646 (+),score=142.43 TRINITY_DN13273_c0_g1_i2:281-2218(+)
MELSEAYNPPAEIQENAECLEEWQELVRKIQPFERDAFRRKAVVQNPTDMERMCAIILSEQLGLNCQCSEEDIVITKPSTQDQEARKVLIEFCAYDDAKGMILPSMDSFELECFRTQGEMLGLHVLKKADSSVHVRKQPPEDSVLLAADSFRSSNDTAAVTPEMQRCRSICRLSTSLQRSSSFCDLEAAEMFRRSTSWPEAPADGTSLRRNESQRVLDQTATLSSSIQNTSFSTMEPQKENVWYINGQTDSNGNVAVFKTEDLDKPSPSDLQDDDCDGTTSSTRSGFGPNSGHPREVAAYKLDHKAWVGVPPTIAYKLTVEGQAVEGSVQGFIDHHHSADEDDSRNPGGWKDHQRYPVAAVHKIGILDVRLFNTDRHGGNLLVREQDGQVQLVPIDHGLCLPDYHYLEMPTQPVWYQWEQAQVPFDDEACRYISSLSLEDDIEILLKCGVEPDSIVTFKLAHTLLRGAVVDMAPCAYTLRDLGELLVQTTVDEPSVFEAWVQQSIKSADDLGGSGPVEWFQENHLMLLASHMRDKMCRQYYTAADYVKVAIDQGALEVAIQKDRLGLDSSGKRKLEQLLLSRPAPPAENTVKLLSLRLAGCTRHLLSEIRDEVCAPMWSWAESISQIGKQVRYPKICLPQANSTL